MLDDFLYPSIEPFATQMLPRGDLHQIYVEQCGNPEGEAILFVHGGPGGGCSKNNRLYFDPEHYHIILVDQRGCGRSTPIAEIRENTTADLIEDFEAIRTHLNIEQWILFGGSWGSTLSLAYAQAHPNRVTAMILRGIFLGTQAEVDWFLGQYGVSQFFPEVVQPFYDLIPTELHGDIFNEYYRRLCSDDAKQAQEAADTWCKLELSVCALAGCPESILEEVLGTPASLALAKIECHYFLHQCFLHQPLIDNVDVIRHIPCAITHGRYDMVCLFKEAWQLYQAWPEAAFYPVTLAGHTASDPELAKQLVTLTDQWRDQQHLH